MKRLLFIVPVLLLLIGGIAFASQEDKVALCHKTDSESHPFIVQLVNANEVQSHEANGDFLYNGPTDKNGHPDPKAGPEWCANSQLGDVCPNIDGLQTKVPDGDVLLKGECIQAPVQPPVQIQGTVTPTITPPVANLPTNK